MKIAFFVYPSAFQNKGGGEILLEKREEYLKRKGVFVKRFDIWQDKLEDFDILHVFGSVKDCLGLMEVAKTKGVKIVLESIFWSSFRRSIFEEGSVTKKIGLVLRHLIKLVFPFFSSSRKKMFEVANLIFPNSEGEAKRISRLFAISMDKMFIVPNGVDIEYIKATPDLFTSKYGIRDFVLSVGRIEPRKNQLNLIRAMKGLDRDLVIVGDVVSGYEWYYEKCKKEASEHVHFLGAFSHTSPFLMSAYAACSVFVLPGWFETPGLAALEASLAGTSVVATIGGSTREYFHDKVLYIRPDNLQDIQHKIKEALSRGKDSSLKDFVLRSYTWDQIIERVLEGYKLVLEK